MGRLTFDSTFLAVMMCPYLLDTCSLGSSQRLERWLPLLSFLWIFFLGQLLSVHCCQGRATGLEAGISSSVPQHWSCGIFSVLPSFCISAYACFALHRNVLIVGVMDLRRVENKEKNKFNMNR